MKQLFVLLSASLLIASCNNKSKENTSTTTTSTDTNNKEPEMRVQIPSISCYLYVSGKDSVKLRLEKFPNVVTGSLSYLFNEKDKNTGTIDGVLHGDTLIADYTFMSEGKSSVRLVAFLVKDSSVIEGYASVEEKDGKTIFKDLSSLDFGKGTILKRRDCPHE